MTNKATKYGLMTIAAVLLVALAFAGAVSADATGDTTHTATSWSDLKTNITTWNSVGGTYMLTVLIPVNFDSSGATGNVDISVSKNVTIKPAVTAGEVTLDAKQQGRLFSVVTGGNLALAGNGSATLNLTGGKITIEDEGAGIKVYYGNLTLSSGVKITNCSHDGSGLKGGGGVAVDYGAFTMTGGDITDCITSVKRGGGVYVINGTFTMTGGNITNCHAAKKAGGVRIAENSIFNVAGTARISGNFNGTEIENVCLVENGELNLIGDFTGSIGISEAGGNPVSGQKFGIAYGGYSGATNFVADDNANLVGSISGGNLVWAEKPIATYVEVNTWAGLNKSIAEWTDTENARTVAVNESILDRAYENETTGINVYGKIILTTNASPAGNEAVINGNGLGRLFQIQNGGNLTLCGNGTSSTLNLTGGNASVISGVINQIGGAIYANSGNLTINNGVKITNCSASYYGGAVYSYRNFTMNGGSIMDCTANGYGGAVIVYNGVFTMNNGTIANCSADYYGGGVEIFEGGEFIMHNGTIANCSADYYGGGVCSYGVFIMNNGTIINCSADDGGGINQDGTFTMNGGYITECDADYGGGIYVDEDATTITGGNIEGNNAYVAGSGIYCEATLVINGTAVVAENNDVALVYDDGDCYPIEMGDTTAYPFTGHIDNITIYDYDTDEEIPSAYLGKSVVVNGSEFSSAFKLRDSSVYSSYQLTTSGNDLILSKKSTPYTPSSSSKQTGSTIILSEGQTAPTAYATAAPTVAPTVKPTEKPATPTVIATEKPTTTPKTPAPFVGLLAGLGAAAVLLSNRRK